MTADVINEILIILDTFYMTIKDFEEDIRILTERILKHYTISQPTLQSIS
jgi:hypothetical protein